MRESIRAAASENGRAVSSTPANGDGGSALRLVAVAAGLALLAGGPLASEVSALTNYVIRDAIHQHLERTGDDHGLCRRQGMSMHQMLLFVPNTTGGVSVYWHRPTDRFVQYPGLSACSVWKRIGA